MGVSRLENQLETVAKKRECYPYTSTVKAPKTKYTAIEFKDRMQHYFINVFSINRLMLLSILKLWYCQIKVWILVFQ